MTTDGFPPLVEACEALFVEHGDNYLGQGWTKSQENTDLRYGVMLDLMAERTSNVSLLDFGCGTANLLRYMVEAGVEGVAYSGLDVSERFIAVAREKFPDVSFHLADILDGPTDLPMFDYVVMNGVFTYKGPLTFDEAVVQWRRLLTAAMAHARVGIAFNATSPYVDWQRDDLFHIPMQVLADVVAASPCPHFRIRHDYGLYETTVYAYRSPQLG
jgi:SAM-dependent methyltransferase